MEQTKPKILAVDDTPENLDVIKEILADQYTLLLTTKAELVQKLPRRGTVNLATASKNVQ